MAQKNPATTQILSLMNLTNAEQYKRINMDNFALE